MDPPLFLLQISDVHTELPLSLQLQRKHFDFLPLAEHLRRTLELNHRKRKLFILHPEITFLVSVTKGHFREPLWDAGLELCGCYDLVWHFTAPNCKWRYQTYTVTEQSKGSRRIFSPTFLLLHGLATYISINCLSTMICIRVA